MEANLDCIPCAMRHALEASRMATEDKSLQEKALKKVAEELSTVPIDGTPLSISHRALRIVGEVTGVSDPYNELKTKYNKKIMDMYPELKRKVTTSDDRLLTAVKLSIAGNIIDFGPGTEFDVEKTIKETPNKDFEIDHFEQLREELNKAEEIVYLSDNAGEIVFDRILLEELEGKKIRFVVKGLPILNDATAEDAEFVGIDKIAKIEEIRGEAGLDNIQEGFKDKLREAELVISKGQANYEAFSKIDANIFFLLMVKCPLIARDIGAEEGSTIVK